MLGVIVVILIYGLPTLGFFGIFYNALQFADAYKDSKMSKSPTAPLPKSPLQYFTQGILSLLLIVGVILVLQMQ